MINGGWSFFGWGRANVGPKPKLDRFAATPHAKTLQDNFKGKLDGARVFTLAPGRDCLAWKGQAGLFSLRSFLAMHEAGKAPKTASSRTVVVPPPKPLPTPKRSGLDAFADLPRGPKALRQRWLQAHARTRSTQASREDALRARIKRDELVQHAARLAPGAPDRVDCALAAVLPGLFNADGESRVTDDGEKDKRTWKSLLDEVGRLDLALRKAGAGAVRLDRLLFSLSCHGSIRTWSESGSELQRMQATLEMREVLRRLLHAVEPGNDGMELDSLLGQSHDLDEAIRSLRLAATTRVMREAIPDEHLADKAAIAHVNRQMLVAKARNRLLDAVRRAKLDHLVGHLADVRINKRVLDGVRARLGEKNARSVGLAFAALNRLEAELTNSEEASALRQGLRRALAKAREKVGKDGPLRNGLEAAKKTGVDKKIKAARHAWSVGVDAARDIEFRLAALEESSEARKLGLDRDELAALALNPRDTVDADLVKALAEAGAASALDVKAAVECINRVVEKVVGTPDRLERFADRQLGSMSATSDGDRALRLRDALAARRENNLSTLRSALARVDRSDDAGLFRNAGLRYLDSQSAFAQLAARLADAPVPVDVELSARTLQSLADLLGTRKTCLAEAHAALQCVIREAILHSRGSESIDTFEPGAHAAQVRRLLDAWGVDLKKFAPEIDAALSQSFGADELNRWLEESAVVLAAKLPEAPAAHRIGQAFATMAPGGSAKTTESWTAGVSAVVPVHPGVSVTGKVEGGGLSWMEYSPTSENPEIRLVDGKTGTVGAGAVLGMPPVPAPVGLSASVGAEVGVQSVSGTVLRADPASASAVSDLVLEGKVSASSLAKIKKLEVLQLVDTRLTAKVEVAGRAVVGVVSDDRAGGIGVGARAGGSWTGQKLWSTAFNTNGSVTKTERDSKWEVAASAFASGQVSLHRDEPHAPRGARGDVIEAGGAWTARRGKHKSKVVMAEGRIAQAGTERIDLVQLPGTLAGRWKAVCELGGPEFQRYVAWLEQEGDESLQALRAIVERAAPNAWLALASTLDERARDEANEWLEQANALRAGRMLPGEVLTRSEIVALAESFEDRAQKLVEDAWSSSPARVFELELDGTTHTGGLAVPGVKAITTSDHRSDFVRNVWRPDSAVARRWADAVRLDENIPQ